MRCICTCRHYIAYVCLTLLYSNACMHSASYVICFQRVITAISIHLMTTRWHRITMTLHSTLAAVSIHSPSAYMWLSRLSAHVGLLWNDWPRLCDVFEVGLLLCEMWRTCLKGSTAHCLPELFVRHGVFDLVILNDLANQSWIFYVLWLLLLLSEHLYNITKSLMRSMHCVSTDSKQKTFETTHKRVQG